MTMNAAHINAFLDATKAVFETMLKIAVTFEKPTLGSVEQHHDVSGVIGLSGDIVGSVVVGFSKLSAAQFASALAGQHVDPNSPDFADAIGELTNMIAGGAKAKFEGFDVSIGCPSVVIAPQHHVKTPRNAATICIPCNTPVGRFTIDVAFQMSAAAAGQTQCPAAKSAA